MESGRGLGFWRNCYSSRRGASMQQHACSAITPRFEVPVRNQDGACRSRSGDGGKASSEDLAGRERAGSRFL